MGLSQRHWDDTGYFSPTFKKMFGYKDHELTNEPLIWQKLIFPEDLPGVLEVLRQHIESHGEFPFYNEVRYRHKNGSTVWVICTGQVIEWDEQGQPVQLVGCHVDITERKQSEDALRETRNYLENLLDYANAPIVVWDPEIRITRFNHAFENFTGYSAQEVIGQELHLLFPEASREESLNKIALASSGEYWESVEIPILRKDGEARIALWNSANIYAADGATLIATIAQGQDITERKQAEEQLQIYLREKEVLLRELHHRVKNNLQVISSLLNLQIRTIEDKATVASFLEIQGRIESIGLIHEQLHRGKDVGKVDFRDYIQHLVVNLFIAYGADSARIKSKLSVGEIFLGIEAAMPLGLIINELVSNCLKHAFPAGAPCGQPGGPLREIRLDLHPTGDGKYLLTVSDNGVGFPQDVDLLKSKTLGLNLINSLTGQLQGAIEFQSGIGTQVKITFAELHYKPRI